MCDSATIYNQSRHYNGAKNSCRVHVNNVVDYNRAGKRES